MAILPDVLVTNRPARVDCGAPDYVLTRKDVPVGYIEAKDIGVDLGSKTLKEQFDRYKSGLSNLILLIIWISILQRWRTNHQNCYCYPSTSSGWQIG